jgi:CelD/BcsL family acetyltransferase involved in cellulose biosynthesis
LQDEPGMIAANGSAPFLRAVLPKLAASGHLRMFSLRWQGAVAAVVATFQHENRIYSYLSAFDPTHEILGFGRTLLYEAFRCAFGTGISEWHFLRGDEAYKYSWGAENIPKLRLTLE